MAAINTLTDIKALLKEHVNGTILRVTNRDITPGMGMHQLFENYAIVTVHETKELDQARQIHPILSLEKTLGQALERTHETGEKDPLQSEALCKEMEELPGPAHYILPYMMHDELPEHLCKEGWHLCSLTSEQQRFFDQRGTFLELATEANIVSPLSVLLSSPTIEQVQEFFNKYGHCVLQEMHESAGMGTTFIETKEDIAAAPIKKGPQLLRQFIDGVDLSCTGCIIDDQILISPVRLNIVGCNSLTNNRAQFCGNDWNVNLPPAATEQLQQYTMQMGEVLRRHNYKGIFGLDAIWSKEEQQTYAIEINPRLLGTTQLYAIQQIEQEQIPLIGLHVLAFLHIGCQVNEVAKQATREAQMTGAHIILRNKHSSPVTVKGEVEPGIYQIKNGQIEFIKPAVHFGEIEEPNQYLITMVPSIDQKVGPQAQLIRIQAKQACFDGFRRELLPESAKLVEYLESALKLTPHET